MMLQFIRLAVFFFIAQSLNCDGLSVYTKSMDGKNQENQIRTQAIASENEQIILFCDTLSKDDSKTTVSWFYQSDETKNTKSSPGVYISGSKDDNPCGKNKAFLKSHFWCLEPATSNLILKRPQRTDNGIFTCLARNFLDSNSISQGGYLLRVLYKPSKPIYTKPKYLVQGKEYELRCQSEGYNLPKYKWFFNEKEIQSLSSKEKSKLNIVEDTIAGTLNILEANSNNFGNYYCQAQNSLGLVKGESFSLGYPFFTDGVIAAIVVGMIILIILIICFFMYRKNKIHVSEGKNVIHYDVPSSFVKYNDLSLTSQANKNSFTPSFKHCSESKSLIFSEDIHSTENNYESKDKYESNKNLLSKNRISTVSLSDASSLYTEKSKISSLVIKK